jgi:hypothetical protein
LQIYILEEDYDNHSAMSAREQDEHPNEEPSNNSQMWVKPMNGSSSYQSFNHHVISNPSSVAKISPQ